MNPQEDRTRIEETRGAEPTGDEKPDGCDVTRDFSGRARYAEAAYIWEHPKDFSRERWNPR